MYKNYFLSWLFLTTFLFFSCGQNYLFEQTHHIENGEWKYENTFDYTFDITDTTKIYNLLLEVEHTVEYAFQNCYFKIYTQFPSGEKTDQLLSIDLADGIGRWQGNCSSTSCTVLLDIQKRAFFNALGTHTITLEQYMRKNPLKGIESLSIKLEDTGVSR